MAVTASGIESIVWAGLLLKLPSIINARSDGFNPTKKIIQYCCKAWTNVLTNTPVSNTYSGVAGGVGVPVGTPIFFPASLAGGAQLITVLSWTGSYAPIVANAYTKDIAAATSLLASYLSSPAPGGGLGTGLILPNNQAPLVSTAGLFLSELTSQFISEGLFTIEDGLPVQLVNLLSALAGVYATMYSSMTTTVPIVYTGPTSPTPLIIPIVPGKVI